MSEKTLTKKIQKIKTKIKDKISNLKDGELKNNLEKTKKIHKIKVKVMDRIKNFKEKRKMKKEEKKSKENQSIKTKFKDKIKNFGKKKLRNQREKSDGEIGVKNLEDWKLRNEQLSDKLNVESKNFQKNLEKVAIENGIESISDKTKKIHKIKTKVKDKLKSIKEKRLRKLKERLMKNGLTQKFKRMYFAYRNKNMEDGRMGNCARCGKCCKLPFRCIFYYKNRCLIYKYRFKQCRVYPARRSDIVSEKCGFWFKE